MLRAATVLNRAGTPEAIYTIAASATQSYAGGTPLKPGINRVTTGNIADAVSLPVATGSGQEINVHVDTAFFISVYPAATDQINQFGLAIAYAIDPRQRIRFLDVAPNLWDFTTNLPLLYPIYFFTAFAGGGQASGVNLGKGSNVLSVVATAGDSAKMPIAIGGCAQIVIYNRGAASANLFPQSGQAINNLANNAAFAIPAGRCAQFTDIGPGPNQWVGGLLALT